jgi:hypothetical protein
LILSHTFWTFEEIQSTAEEQIFFNHENKPSQILVMVVFRVSNIAGKSIQKSAKTFINVSIQTAVILFRFSKAHFQFHEKTFLKKSITSLKTNVTHLTISVIALKLDLTTSTTNNKVHLTDSLKNSQIGIRIGSNCL